jgi:hypothetical protein
MITFYRDKECGKCDFVADSLKDMHLAHKVVVIDNGPDITGALLGTSPPLLVFDNEKVQGDDNIIKYLEVLEAVKKEWDESMANACRCDDA